MEKNFLASRCQTRELNSFRLLHYAGDVPASDKEDVGISAHTDFECITLLYQDSPGLELRATDGRWLDADIGVGRIIVMLDDMLERWTNGNFSATGHRVRQTGKQRFSIVMFIAVDDGLTIAPLEQFTSADNPPRYRPVTQAAHLDAEIRARDRKCRAGIVPRRKLLRTIRVHIDEFHCQRGASERRDVTDIIGGRRLQPGPSPGSG